MPSVRGRLTTWLLRVTTPKGRTFLKPIDQQRQEMEQRMARFKLPRGVRQEAAMADGVPGEWLIPPGGGSGRVLMYLHGGGYYNGSLATHRAVVARLARALQARAFHIDYRRAPEHPFPAGVEDCFRTYRWLLNNAPPARSLAIGGESAGGNLVMTTLLAARDHGLPLPGAAFCLSPHLDFTFSGASITSNAHGECLYTLEELEWMRGLYLGPRAADASLWASPRVSPLHADLAGLPPLLLHASATEMLRDDAITLAQRVRAAGGTAELKIWPGLFHGFHMVPFLPETRQALREIAAFVARHGG
ncbi:MAG: alpha/beta hydrolase [Magnetococcales bacterium]|nr:alpha/beta hydrolase [Magnetococcales bacterium]